MKAKRYILVQKNMKIILFTKIKKEEINIYQKQRKSQKKWRVYL